MDRDRCGAADHRSEAVESTARGTDDVAPGTVSAHEDDPGPATIAAPAMRGGPAGGTTDMKRSIEKGPRDVTAEAFREIRMEGATADR